MSDSRLGVGGLPLRRTRPLEFLDGPDKDLSQQQRKATWRLYEGQISALITGIDDWRNEALVLVDAFFDRSLSTKHSHDCGGVLMDPLTKGELMVNAASTDFQHPRLYFLEITEVWVYHIKKEWHFIVDEITASFDT